MQIRFATLSNCGNLLKIFATKVNLKKFTGPELNWGIVIMQYMIKSLLIFKMDKHAAKA
jgi:hypothetical protein